MGTATVADLMDEKLDKSIERVIRDLDADYHARRKLLQDELLSAANRVELIATLDATTQELAAKNAALSAARAALDDAFVRVGLEVEELNGDVDAWRVEFERVIETMKGLALMHSVFAGRGQQLATQIGELAVNHAGAFVDGREQMGWVSAQLSALPSAVDLAPSSECISTDTARILGVKVARQDLLSRGYESAATAVMRRAAKAATNGR